ncbi:MAG: helix-turn-helix domain-containing protein [Candidatus Omnitrophota bacterium]
MAKNRYPLKRYFRKIFVAKSQLLCYIFFMVEIKNFRVTINQKPSLVHFDFREERIRPLIPIENKGENWTNALSVTQFAEEAGITPQAVRKMISERRLSAKKLGEQYAILREELDRYLQRK